MLDPWRLHLLHQLHLRGTVRAVAEVCRMSPSSVSAQLATLEREARTQLFERTGRRIALTPMGVMLAVRAEELLDHHAAVESEVANLHAEPTGPVRLAAFASALRAFVIPAAGTIRRDFPGIELEILEAEPHQSLPAVQRGELDLAVSADFGDGEVPVDAALMGLPLFEDEFVLVAAADRTDLGPGLALADLAAERWALEASGTYLADRAERVCRMAGFEPQVTGRFSSYAALLQHVEAGLSVTMLPQLAVADRPGVRAITLADPLRRTVQIVARRAATTRAAVRAVIGVLRTGAAEMSPPWGSGRGAQAPR